MTEEKSNEMFIKNKLSGIEERYIPEIKKMLSERYVEGLRQAKFDTTMDFAYQLNDAIDELAVLRKYIQALSPSNLVVIEKQINKIENILKGSENNE